MYNNDWPTCSPLRLPSGFRCAILRVNGRRPCKPNCCRKQTSFGPLLAYTAYGFRRCILDTPDGPVGRVASNLYTAYGSIRGIQLYPWWTRRPCRDLHKTMALELSQWIWWWTRRPCSAKGSPGNFWSCFLKFEIENNNITICFLKFAHPQIFLRLQKN